METFYITLVRELAGYCIVAVAPNENTVREYCAKNYGNLWCSVYNHPVNEQAIGEILYL